MDEELIKDICPIKVGQRIPIMKGNFPYIKISPYGVMAEDIITDIMYLKKFDTDEYYFLYEFYTSGEGRFYDLRLSRRTDISGRRGFKKKRVRLPKYCYDEGSITKRNWKEHELEELLKS